MTNRNDQELNKLDNLEEAEEKGKIEKQTRGQYRP